MKAKIPTSLAEFMALAKKLGAKNADKAFSPVYIAGTDWYVAMSFVYDYGGKIAITRKGKWVGTLDKPAALAGLAAYKRFFDASLSRAARRPTKRIRSRTTSWPRATPPRRTGPHGSPAASATTSPVEQFVMPSHTKGQPIPGFLGGSDLAVPIGANKDSGSRWISAFTDNASHDRAPREGQHPEHDQPARQQRQRARGPQELVRPDREELGQRRERERPPHDAPANPDGQVRPSSRPRRSRATTSPTR